MFKSLIKKGKEKKMKKLIAFAVALLFLSVTGIAAAYDVQMSGSYFVRGTYQKNAEEGDVNDGLQSIDESGTMYYDHELDLKLNWKIDDNTIIYSQIEMRDEAWGSNNVQDYSYSTNPTSYKAASDNEKDLDDNIIVEKVYVWHKFANGHETKLGLMPSGAWATSFQDDASEVYRVRYDIPTDAVRIIGILQKYYSGESGDASNGQGESDDQDAYILGFLAKAGDINVKPLFAYANIGNIKDVLKTNIGFDGTFGAIGFESEFGVVDSNFEAAGTQDSRTYGAYANLWYASGPVQAGILGAFGSYDDDANAAHGFGGDFDAGGAMIMGVDAGFGGVTVAADGTVSGTVNDNLAAGRLVALYADYDINDKLSIGGYAGFAKCGIDDADNDEWNGAKVWEISADAAYKITDNIKYDVGAGVAQLKLGKAPAGVSDPEKAYRLFHRLTVNF